jgi:hypothetical protein
MLVESPCELSITSETIQQSAHKGTVFSDKECHVAQHIANWLRPYVPRRVQSEMRDGTRPAAAHFLLRSPVAIIANNVLRATGYSQFCRKLFPEVSPASVHGLQIGAPSLYEIFGDSINGDFDIKDHNHNTITNLTMIKSTEEGRRAIFSNFFDVDRIEQICDEHGLLFRHR